MDKEMMKALEADGEKLRKLTGEDHGPFCSECLGTGNGPSGKCVYTGEIVDAPCPSCGGTGRAQ